MNNGNGNTQTSEGIKTDQGRGITTTQADEIFQAHALTADGRRKVADIRDAFTDMAARLRMSMPEGRELALARTKLQEACFWAINGTAKANSEPINT